MKVKYRSKVWLFCLLLLPPVVRAQPVVHATALVDSISSSGFYRIVLPPQFVAKCKFDLSDLRILKPDGGQVPYVLRTKLDDRLNAGYLPIPDPTIRRRDSSNKHSYYWLQYDDAYRIDRLSLIVSDPVLYKREVRILACKDSGDLVPVISVSIDPNDTAFRLPAIKTRTLVIDIANGDNPPLTINHVASAQSGIYILTYLLFISHYGYKFYSGLGDYGPPDYDLHFFTDSLRRHPRDLGLNPIVMESESGPSRRDSTLQQPRATGSKGSIPPNRKSGFLLWASLLIVLFILIYFSIRMVKAIGKKDSHDRL
jgi:hypothetical protein